MKIDCKIDGCTSPSYCRGWCTRHYGRWKNHGSPTGGRVGCGDLRQWIKDHVAYAGKECLPWPFSRKENGYAQMMIDGVQTIASRVMCIEAHGPPPTPEHLAAHSCGKGQDACMNQNHIRWATPLENSEDSRKHGTTAKGEKNGKAKLTSEQVAVLMASSEPVPVIALDLSISIGHAYRIRRKERWHAG